MSVSVVTYNILADAYVRPERYPGVAPAMLEPGRRREALLEHLDRLRADVLCLQEVEREAYHAIDQRLAPHGYVGRFRLKAGGRSDGCATFVRSTTPIRADGSIAFADGRAGEPASGHIALFVLIEIAGRAVGIANTHLKWDPPATPPARQWGVRQATELVRECREFAPACRDWILCGDLNAGPDSGVLHVFAGAGFRDAFAGRPNAFSCNSSRRAKRIDFLLHTAGLSARRIDPPPIGNDTPLPGEGQPSDHLAITAQFEIVAG